MLRCSSLRCFLLRCDRCCDAAASLDAALFLAALLLAALLLAALSPLLCRQMRHCFLWPLCGHCFRLRGDHAPLVTRRRLPPSAILRVVRVPQPFALDSPSFFSSLFFMSFDVSCCFSFLSFGMSFDLPCCVSSLSFGMSFDLPCFSFMFFVAF